MHVPFWHLICNDDIYEYKNELRKYGDHPPPNYNILDSILIKFMINLELSPTSFINFGMNNL